MKKLFLLLVLVSSISVFAQKKINEGVIVTKQTMHTDNEMVKQQIASMGDMSTTTYFKKGKSRVEFSNPMSGDVISIINQDANEMLMLMNNPMMGKLYAKKALEISDEKLNKLKVTHKDETKTFLGYECKRVDVTTEEQGVEVTISFYVTDAFQIPTPETTKFGDKLKGLPMYFEMEMNQMGVAIVIKYEVTEVRDEKVDDSKFDMSIPEGYVENKMILGQN